MNLFDKCAVFLKATIKKMIMVPGYTKSDGTYVPPHQKMVHVDPSKDAHAVVSGNGSHSQKLAHKKLHASHSGFKDLPSDVQFALISSHATDIQEKDSFKAQISVWKKQVLAGQKPKPANAKAFAKLQETDPEKAQKLLDEVVSKIGPEALQRLMATEPAGKKPATAQPAPEEPKGKAVPIIDWGQYKLPDTNTNAGSHNKKVAQIQQHHEAGDVVALQGMKFGTNTYGKKQAKLAEVAVAHLKEFGGQKTMTAGQSVLEPAVKAPPPAPKKVVLPKAEKPKGLTEHAFHHTGAGHNKFWSVSVDADGVLTKKWGKIGTAGQSKTWNYGSPAAAVSAAKEMMKEKEVKGYKLQSFGAGGDFGDPAPDATAPAPDGPKEGDTKPGADGGLLVFKNGRWHKATPAAGSGSKKLDGLSVAVADKWEQVGPAKGSNPGGMFKDQHGKQWYVKFPKTADHAKNELLAAKLYKMAGVDVPTLRLVERNGKIGIASKFEEGVSQVGAGMKDVPGAHEGFAVDAWLGNYDAVGTGYDNLLKTKDDKAIRIDVGGSLIYRAQGAKKTDFGNEVKELDTMRNAGVNPYSHAVFGGISDKALSDSVVSILEIPDEAIGKMVEKYGPGSPKDKVALAKKLIARKAYLAQKFPEAELKANPPKPDPRKLPVDASKLPNLPNFLNWNNKGSGLSSVAAVNEANQAVVQEIYDAALKGDFIKIQKLKYHVVDKQTGAVSEGDVFANHPSQHVRDFYSNVIDYLSVVASPAAEKPKNWDVGDYTDILDLSEAFPAHLYGVTVGAVPANERLGFWISLGQAEGPEVFMPENVDYISAKDKKKGKASVAALPEKLKKWMAAVKSSGAHNQPYRDGKEVDNQGQNTRDVLTEAYAHSVELSEGTRITKNISFPAAMMKQMMEAPMGHVFQNPGSMCCSINKDWQGFSGNARLKIIYAKGAKALYNIGVGSYDAEGEITTVPGQRFMIVEKVTMPDGNPEFTLLMLPPDETYVANIYPKG